MASSKQKAITVTLIVVVLVSIAAVWFLRSPHRRAFSSAGDSSPSKQAIMAQMKTVQMTVIPAFIQYAEAHQDQVAKSFSDLKPYLPPNAAGFDDNHWTIVGSGKLTPQLTQKNIVLLEQKNVPPGQPKMVGFTDGHFTFQ